MQTKKREEIKPTEGHLLVVVDNTLYEIREEIFNELDVDNTAGEDYEERLSAIEYHGHRLADVKTFQR